MPISNAASPASWSLKAAGASLLFPPAHPHPERAKEAVLHVLRRDPHQLGVARARWTLAHLLAHLPWLRLRTPAGLWRLLRRLHLGYKRARDHVHSPDPDYDAKLAVVAAVRRQAQEQPRATVVLYLDEITIYRQPTLSWAYEEQGPTQPLAQRSYGRNTATRVIAALDTRDGRVVYHQARHIGLSELVSFYQQVRAAYPTAQRLYLVMDNWPIHWHPDVLTALEPQESTFPVYRPPNWRLHPRRETVGRWRELALPIQLVPLPTYASWCNPIEKLWRKLRQEELHLHRLAEALAELRQRIATWLEQYDQGSQELLQYVGLLS